jgi:hypothetical protein
MKHNRGLKNRSFRAHSRNSCKPAAPAAPPSPSPSHRPRCRHRRPTRRRDRRDMHVRGRRRPRVQARGRCVVAIEESQGAQPSEPANPGGRKAGGGSDFEEGLPTMAPSLRGTVVGSTPDVDVLEVFHRHRRPGLWRPAAGCRFLFWSLCNIPPIKWRCETVRATPSSDVESAGVAVVSSPTVVLQLPELG